MNSGVQTGRRSAAVVAAVAALVVAAAPGAGQPVTRWADGVEGDWHAGSSWVGGVPPAQRGSVVIDRGTVWLGRSMWEGADAIATGFTLHDTLRMNSHHSTLSVEGTADLRDATLHLQDGTAGFYGTLSDSTRLTVHLEEVGFHVGPSNSYYPRFNLAGGTALAATAVVRTSGGGGAFTSTSTGTPVRMYGQTIADTPQGDLWCLGIANYGVATVSNGGRLVLHRSPNHGTVRVEQAHLTLDDQPYAAGAFDLTDSTATFTHTTWNPATLANWTVSGSDVRFTDGLDLAGATLTADGLFDQWAMDGEVRNGRVVAATGVTLDIAKARFYGVTLSGDLRQRYAVGGRFAAGVYLGEATTLDRATILIEGSDYHTPAGVQFGADQAVLPAGSRIILAGKSPSTAMVMPADATTPKTLTIANGAVVETAGGHGTLGGLGDVAGTARTSGYLVNHGLVRAAGAGSTLNVGFDPHATKPQKFTNETDGVVEATAGGIIQMQSRWTNRGTFRLDGGELRLGGVFTVGDIGTIERTAAPGRLAITGDLTSTGAPLNLDPMGVVELADSGSISGVRVEGSGALRAAGGKLFQATIASGLIIPGGQSLQLDSITFDGARVRIGEPGDLTYAAIFCRGGFPGTAEIGFHAGVTSGLLQFSSSIGTIEPGVTVHAVEGSGRLDLDLAARDSAANLHVGADRQLLVTGNRWTSSATPGVFHYPQFTHRGAVTIDAGGLGGFGQDVQWAAVGGTVDLRGGSFLLGGRTTTDSVAAIHRSGGTVYFCGDLDNTGRTLRLDADTGSWWVGAPPVVPHSTSPSGALWDSTAVIRGGTLSFADGAGLVLQDPSTLTLDSVALDDSVRLDITSGRRLELLGDWTNAGVVRLDGGTLAVGGTALAQHLPTTQLIRGDLILQGTLDNTGHHLNLAGPDLQWTFDNGTLIGGTIASPHRPIRINAGAAATLRDLTLPEGTTVVLDNDRRLTLEGDWSNRGHILLQPGCNDTARLTLAGTFTPAGVGQVTTYRAVWVAGHVTGPGVLQLPGGMILHNGAVAERVTLAEAPGGYVTLSGAELRDAALRGGAVASAVGNVVRGTLTLDDATAHLWGDRSTVPTRPALHFATGGVVAGRGALWAYSDGLIIDAAPGVGLTLRPGVTLATDPDQYDILATINLPGGALVNEGRIDWASRPSPYLPEIYLRRLNVNAAAFEQRGGLRLDRSFVNFVGDRFENFGTITIDGDHDASYGSVGELRITAGTVINHPGAVIDGDGTLTVIDPATLLPGTIVNYGVIAPGLSPGTLTIAGNLVLAPGGELRLELDADGLGDRLVVGGTVQFGGTLTVVLPAGATLPEHFNPAVYFNAAAVQGQFDAVVVKPVPEPAAAATLALLAALAGGARRLARRPTH